MSTCAGNVLIDVSMYQTHPNCYCTSVKNVNFDITAELAPVHSIHGTKRGIGW